ncbi:MAG: aminotransferase class I/II-fold pyridoxal phosphate-dependent enzyme [Candidatus Omnitrophota bacterium]
MKNIISKKVLDMQPSGIRVFFDLVLGMKDVISLGVGEPDFATPWNIREAGIFSLEKGFTTYTSNKGLMKLRLIIRNHVKKISGVEYCPEDEILVTVGVSEGFDLLLRTIISKGDEVLIPHPSFVSYAPLTELCGGKPVLIGLSQENKFKLLPWMIDENCTKNTKAIILNYPCNPTGASYTRQELLELKKIIVKHNLLVISDEIYGDLTYDFEHTPFVSLGGVKERTVYLNGFSKGYAMTGWRIGYACGPKEIISAMTKIHQYSIMCVATTSQWAACEALSYGERSVLEMKKEYAKRRNFVVERLNSMGLDCIMPEGAFYAFPSIKKISNNSLEFSSQLLKKKKVAVVPGGAFGTNSHIRISYASKLEVLKEALTRIEDFLNSNERY